MAEHVADTMMAKAERTKLAASPVMAATAPTVPTRRPASPGPAIMLPDRLISRAAFPAISSSRSTTAGR